MQMNQRCGGRFHHQRVSCRSDFKETRRVSFQILQLFNFCVPKVTSRRRFFFLLLTLFDIFLTQIIASEGEGRKPSSDRDKYVAESEFALLGILSNNVNKYLSI